MKKSRLIFSLVALGADLLMLIFSFILAYIIRTNIDVKPLATPTDLFVYLKLVLLLASLDIIIFFFVGLYNVRKPDGRIEELKKIFIGVSAGTMIVIFLDFVKTEHIFPAKAIPIYSWGLAILLVFLSRQILREIQRYFFKYGIGVQNTLVIGANRISSLLLSEIRKNPYLGYKIVGILDKRKVGKDFAGFKVIESENALQDILKTRKIDEIIQANPQLPSKKVIEIINLAEKHRTDFKFAPSLFGVYTANTHVRIFGGIPVVELKKTPLEGWGRIIKRLTDITGALFGLIILSPVFLVISLFIKLTSKGPVFYKHGRLGRFGKKFDMYKFRTMKTEYCRGEEYGGKRAEEHFKKILCDPEKKKEFSEDFKLKDDPRVTKFGKLLRKTSLDEIPQLINVLKGEMSLVGPRPVVKEELKKYGPHQQERLILKPGMTGLWQISGRSDLSYSERAKLDTYYVENWSILLDLKIILKTFLVFFKIKNAY